MKPAAPGEIKARDYIVKSFKSAGLKPKGEKGFLQPFTFTAGATFGPGTQLYVNNYSFKVNDDFTPLPYSGNGVITGYVARLGYGRSTTTNSVVKITKGSSTSPKRSSRWNRVRRTARTRTVSSASGPTCGRNSTSRSSAGPRP